MVELLSISYIQYPKRKVWCCFYEIVFLMSDFSLLHSLGLKKLKEDYTMNGFRQNIGLDPKILSFYTILDSWH